MKIIDENSAAAKQHPKIKTFEKLVEETVGDGILDFRQLQERPFMEHWNHLIINRVEDNKNDFRAIFFGTFFVRIYGADYTGKLISETGKDAGDYNTIIDLNMRIINGEKRVYASGNLFWHNKKYKYWHQVKMPLRRNGSVNEVLIYMDFD